MLVRLNKYPYTLFYLNSEGKYETKSFKYTFEVPEVFMQKTSYLYTDLGQGVINLKPSWFKCGEPDSYHNNRFTHIDAEDVPSEVLALSLLIGD